MMNGRNNGKKIMAVRIVQHAFEIIHLVTEQNPIQVLVDAIVNTGPREDSTRIGSQGTVRRQAVDVSPLRRVNQAISLLTIGVSTPGRFLDLDSLLIVVDPRVSLPQLQVGLRVPCRRARQRRKGLLQLVRDQEEGRARACGQVQPLIAICRGVRFGW
jgi:small subunit ribosomal protein S5e